MKDLFIKHFKDNNFTMEVEPDGDESIVKVISDECGNTFLTFVFDANGNLRDIWNDVKEEFDDYKKENEKYIEAGKSILTIAKLFNPKLGEAE